MEAESATAESITEDVQIDVQNPSYEDIDNMAKNRTLEEITETSNKVPIGIKKSSEGDFLAQAPSGVHVSPREILKDSDVVPHAEQPYEEKEMPKHEVFQGIDSVSKLGDPKKDTTEEDLQSEAGHTNLCTPAANACSGNKKGTSEDSENALDSASDNLIISQDKNAPNHVKSEENTKEDALGNKQLEEGIHNSQWDENLLTGLGVVKLAETSLLGSSFQNHEPADTDKNAEEKATETEDQHMSKDVENISTEEKILPNIKEGQLTVNKELLEESSNVASYEKIPKPSEERGEQEKDTQQGKQNSLEDSKAKYQTIEEQSFLPAKQVSEDTSVNGKERSDPEKGLENDVQEEEKAAEESYITSFISELDKEMHSAIGAEETLIHEEVSDSLKDKGRIQDELEMDVADSNVTKHDMQEALEENAEESLIVNETTRREDYNKLEMFDYKESDKQKAKVHDESCNSSSHSPLNEASAHDNKERNPETKIEEIVNEASNQDNLELGNTKDGRGSNLVENIDGGPSKPEICQQILELQKKINGENEDEPVFNMKVSLAVTKEIDQDFSIVKKKNEDKEATGPGHLIVNEEKKLENSSHMSSDVIPKQSEPGNKQENKVMEKKEDFLEVQPNKDKHDLREEQNNIPANRVSEEETVHDQESVDSRKALEKYVQEEKEAKGSTNTLSISESYKKTDSVLEAKATENFEEVSNFFKDKDQIQEALEKDVQEEKAGKGSTNTLSILESHKKTDSPLEVKETENSEEVSNFLKDKDQIQDELDKDVADPHEIKYDCQEAPKVNTEISKEHEAATGAEHNKLEMLEDEEDVNRSVEVHDDSCNSSSHSLLNKASKQEDTETDPKTRIKEIVDEAVNQEKLEGKVKDGSECNQVDNFEGIPEVTEINKRISKPQKETMNKDEMILEIKQRLQEVTEEIDQDLSVIKQKNKGKEASESGQLTMNVEEDREEYSCVASNENIPKPSKQSNKLEKEALVRKDDFLEEDQQTKDKDETKKEQNLIPVNEISEEAIIHDQGAEDSGKGLETKVQKEEKNKEATELGQLTMNVEEEHEQSSCVASDENIPKPSKPSNKQEKEALERKDGSLEEDQQTKDKDETKEEQNLTLVNEVSEEAIIHDQGAEDSGKGLETKVRKEEKVDTEGSITPTISESNNETDSATGEQETENSEEVSNLLKDKDQIQDEFHKDSVDTHVSKYDVQGALETNAEENLTGNEAVTGTENNDHGMLEDEKDANKRAAIHDDSCNDSSSGLLNKASEHEDTERVLDQKKVESVEEGIKQEKFYLVNIQDGGESNQVENFDVLGNISIIISQQILESQKKIVGEDETVLEEEIDQDLFVMKQKKEGKEATESSQLTMNVEEEHEESSCVASDENIPKPSKPSNRQEKEALERKDGFLEEDQQTKDKDETKEEQNLIPVNEVSEEAIFQDQGAEDSGKGLETRVREEEKVDTESGITPSNLESNKETDSATGEKETENSEEVSNLLKDKDQIQDEFHKDSVYTHVSKYDVQGAIETNVEESLTGNEVVTGTENNDLGMLEDEKDANKRAKIHDDSCNGSSNGLLNKASEHEDTERVLEQKKVEIAEEAIKQEKFYLVNIQDGGESNQVDNFDVLANISIISQQILESQKKIVGKDETVLEMKERLQEATDEIDQDLSVMKQKNEGKEATESGQLTMNVEEEHEESSCVASYENIPKPSTLSNKQEKEALERKDGFVEDQQTKDKDKTKEEQNLIPVNEVSDNAIIHDQGAEDSGNELETKVQEEEKVDTEGSITPSISESNKETDSAIGEKETKNSEEVPNFLKDRDQIQYEFHKDAVDTHVLKYDVQETLETNAEESLTGNEAVTGTENNDLVMLEDEKDANRRAKVHDDSSNGSSNGLLNKASEHEDTEIVHDQKKVESVEEAIKQKKLDLGNIQDSRESNKVDDFDAIADIPEIGQQISEHRKEITGKDEMILEMKGLQEVNKEIDQHLAVTKPKYEASSTVPCEKETESDQLIVNVENKLEESSRLASDENIPKPLKPNNKIEKEVREKKEDFFIEQQIKDKDETREEQNTIPASQVSGEKIVPDQERSDSRKGLETDVREEEKEANGSNISESEKEIDSAIGSRETDNFQEASKLLKDKDHIQDELDKNVADNNVTKYDVQEALEANAEESLTGKEAATVVHNNLGIPEDEEDAQSRAKVHVDSCNGSSNGLLNEASEYEDTESDPEPKKEEIVDEALKQEKLHLGNIQYGRESNQADNFDVVSDISEISEQITESRKEFAGKDEMILDMNESLHEVTEEIYQDLFVTKLKYEGKEATESGHLIVNKEEELEESSNMASAENIHSPSEPCSKAGEEVQEMEENFLKHTQQSKAEDETIEEQNFARDNQVSDEKIVHNQERIDSCKGLEKEVQEEKAATESDTTSFISNSDKEMHSAIRVKEVQNFEEVSSSLKDKDQVQNELDKDVLNTHVIKYDMQEALVFIAEESLTGNEAARVAEYNKPEKQNDEDYVETIANDQVESCNNCFQGSLDDASKHKDIQRDQEPTIEEVSSETINQENIDLGNIKDGTKSKQVEKYIAEPRREILDKDGHNKITGTDELILNIKESFQEVKEKIDQDFPVMKQKDEDKEATKSWVHAKIAAVEYEVSKEEVFAMQDEDDLVEKSTPKANHMNNCAAYCGHEEPVYNFKCDTDTQNQETEPENPMNAYESVSEDQSTGIANTEASGIGVEQEVMNINKTIDDSQGYMKELIELSRSIPKEKEHSDRVTMVEEAIHAREAENKTRKTTVFEAEQRDADLSLHKKQKEGKEPDDMNEAQHENICCGEGLDYESFPKENPAKTVPHGVIKNNASNENLRNPSTKQSDDFDRKEIIDDQELIGQENVEAGLILDQADIHMDDDIPTDKPEGNNVEDTQVTTIHNDNENAKDEDASKSKNDDYTSERLLLQHENKGGHQTQTRAWAEGMEQAKNKEQNDAELLKEMASEITDSIEHDERACLEHKASPQANSEGKLKEVILEKNLHETTEKLQIELGIDNFDEDAQVKQYASDNIEERHLKDKDEILLKERAEWKSNYITEPIQSYDTKDLITLPDEEIETQDAEKYLQNEDASYKQPHTGMSEKIEDKEVPSSSLGEEKMEQVQENADEIKEKTLIAASLENELQQKSEALNVSLQENQIHQMELKKQTKNRSDKAGTDDVGLKIETSIMPDDSVTAATMEDKNSMPPQGNQNYSAIKLNETTRHGTPTTEIERDTSSGEHKSDMEVQADIASIVISADVFSPNKSAAKNDENADDDPQEVTAHIKETTHIDDKQNGAAAESSMQSQGRQQHQKKQVYEPTIEEKLKQLELEKTPIKDQELAETSNYGTMKDKPAAKVKQLPQQSMKEQDIDKDTDERVVKIQNAGDEVGKSIANYNDIESKLVGQNNDYNAHCSCTKMSSIGLKTIKMVKDQATCMKDNEANKDEVTDDISYKITKNTVAEEHITEAAVSCLEDEKIHEELQDDGDKNKKSEKILTENEQEHKASDATERKVSNDKIKEFISPSSEENPAVTGFSEKTNPKDEENSSKNLDFHQAIASLETTQQEGDVLSVPKTNLKKKFETGTEDENHFKEEELDCRIESSEIKDVEDTWAHEINESDKVTPIGASKLQLSNEALMTETKYQEGSKKKTDEPGSSSKDDAGKHYFSAEIGKHEKSLQSVSVISQQADTSPSEEIDILQPSKELHNKITEVSNFDDEKNQPHHNDLPVSRFLMDHILREDKLHKSHVMELESKPEEKNELDKNGVSFKEQVTTALLPSKQTSEEKCTSDEAEAQNLEHLTDIKQEEKNNSEQEGTSITLPSEHASIERDTSEEATAEHQKFEQTIDSNQDEMNNDAKEYKIDMIKSINATQDSIFDSSAVTTVGDNVENVFSYTNPFSGVSNKHIISSTSQLTTLEQDQVYIDGLVDTNLVQGEKDNEVNIEKQIKERGIHEVKKRPQEGVEIPSNVIVYDDNVLYEEDGNENKASNAIPQESSPLISELNQKEKNMVQREEDIPTCESTEDSVLQESKLHGNMNDNFKIRKTESAELNPVQVSHSEAQDVKNASTKMNLADTLNIQKAELENFGTCKKEAAKSVLAQVEESDQEKGEKEDKEDGESRTVQVTEKKVEDCTSVSKVEKGKVEVTINQVGEDNTDEERDEKEVEEGHKDEETGHETSTNVNYRDVVKPLHKKSHNILSGVGSKVKHSIAKVKNAIIGKSSHSKTSTPK